MTLALKVKIFNVLPRLNEKVLLNFLFFNKICLLHIFPRWFLIRPENFQVKKESIPLTALERLSTIQL